eukprot:783348-Pyramimonas_sp.AAC.1
MAMLSISALVLGLRMHGSAWSQPSRWLAWTRTFLEFREERGRSCFFQRRSTGGDARRRAISARGAPAHDSRNNAKPI